MNTFIEDQINSYFSDKNVFFRILIETETWNVLSTILLFLFIQFMHTFILISCFRNCLNIFVFWQNIKNVLTLLTIFQFILCLKCYHFIQFQPSMGYNHSTNQHFLVSLLLFLLYRTCLFFPLNLKKRI